MEQLSFTEALGMAPGNGWLTKVEASVLWEIVKALPPDSNVLEIGVYFGRSASILAAAMKGNGRGMLCLCDPFEDGHHFNEETEPGKKEEALASIQKAIRAVNAESLLYLYKMRDVDAFELAHLKLFRFGLIYLDGDHSYEATLWSLEHWVTRLMPGGLICVHDYNDWGGGAEVKRAIEDCVAVKMVCRYERMAVCRATSILEA